MAEATIEWSMLLRFVLCLIKSEVSHSNTEHGQAEVFTTKQGKGVKKKIIKDLNSPPPSVRRSIAQPDDILVYPITQQAIPGVSKKRLRDLDYLRSPAYLDRVLNNDTNNNNLSLTERESLLKAEKYRSKTFMVNWPHGENTSFSGPKMAQAGFYCLNDGDAVSCAFCQRLMRGWSVDEGNPMMKHRMLNPDCGFVKGRRCGNIEYSEYIAAQDSTLRHGDMKDDRWTVFDVELRNNPFRSTGYPTCGEHRDRLGITTGLLSQNPNYATVPSRLETFKTGWPANTPSALKMSNAGFYFTDFKDEVRCFLCDEVFNNWTADADPWEAHARWSPNCSFLKAYQDEEYIDRIHREWKIEVGHMVELCEKLGYSQNTIKKALVVRNSCYDKVGEMLDVVFAIKNDEPIPVSNKVMFEPKKRMTGEQPVNVNNPGTCKTCKDGTRACHVGLPCGNLIFCNPCNRKQLEKACEDSLYKVICPTCKAVVAASTKVFFG